MKENKITSYKLFDKNLRCDKFQYKIGKEYETDDDIEGGKGGFEAYPNPLDLFNQYKRRDNDRICEVEQSGNIKTMDRGAIKSSKIKIKAEIGIPELYKIGIEKIKEITNPLPIEETNSALSYTYIGGGGYGANIASNNDYVKIGASGNNPKISASGEFATIGASGEFASIGTSGNEVVIGSSGKSAMIAASGVGVVIGSSGDQAMIGTSGFGAHIDSNGGGAHITSSGEFTTIGASGDQAIIGTSGYQAIIHSTGKYSVICCAGNNSMAQAKVGSWITLSEWKYSEDAKKLIPVCVKTEYVDGERIKADTLYELIDGEFKEYERMEEIRNGKRQ